MINVSNLSFEYGGKTVLHDVSFNISQNSVVALVGPNGAGKTTLMRCMAVLHTPVSGVIQIDNINSLENPRAVHRCTGYLSDFFGLYDALTVRQSLLNMAWCQKIPQNKVGRRIDDVANDTGLTEHLDKKAGTLSRGYRQRLGVALAIIHKPKILLLDEPASGMDPEARIQLSELMLSLKAQGMTIVVSSHILAELEDYCSDMLVIRDGRVRKHIVQSDKKEDEIVFVSVRFLDMDDRYANIVSAQNYVQNIKVKDNELNFSYSGGDIGLSQLLKALISNDIPVLNFEVKKKTLQAAYMDLAKTKDKASEGDKI